MVAGIVLGIALARFHAAGPTSGERGSRAMVVHDELRRALDRDELVLRYQPKVELGTGRVSCLEALARWQHPERGPFSPDELVSVAEQRPELIGSLTRWVLRRALADHNAWTAAGHDWTVAVNITAQDLESLNFAAIVALILKEAGVSPERLALEVSETALASTAELADQVIGALATQGIVMSFVDFGTGFMSRSRLRTLKVSEVKIARTFIAALPGDRATVRSLIDLGSRLGCLVTAVGVEWQEMSDWLLDAGCDHGQGYLWLRARAWTEVSQVFGPGGANYSDERFHPIARPLGVVEISGGLIVISGSPAGISQTVIRAVGFGALLDAMPDARSCLGIRGGSTTRNPVGPAGATAL